MKAFAAFAALGLLVASPALAGDPAAGEKTFKKCKSCHAVSDGDNVVVKGGKTGPNLWGVIGRQAGSADFKYGKDLVAAGEGGLVWDEESLAAYITDPKGYLKEVTGNDKAKSKMSYKLKKGAEDVAAFLAQHGS